MDTQHLRELDAADPLAAFKRVFALPDGLIYLAGNSLGALPRATPARIAAAVEEEWGSSLVQAWTTRDWIGAPARVGDKIARLIGAAPGEVIVADSTSVDLFKLIAAALMARPERKTLLAVRGEFPTDLYVANGAVDMAGGGRRIALVERDGIGAALDEDVALLVLTHGHYKTA